MNYKQIIISIAGVFISCTINSTTCPDPLSTSLRWGEIPTPWIANPFSSNRVQGGVNTQFSRANILIAGYGRGVVCEYKFPLGSYSIWWPVLVKIPSRMDYNWIETYMSLVCSQSILSCQFTVAQ